MYAETKLVDIALRTTVARAFRWRSNRMRKTRVIAVTIAALSLLVTGFAPPASASHAWANYHWARQSNPFTLKLGNNVSPAWTGYLSTASGQWSQSSVLDTAVITGGTTAKRCRATTGRVEVCSAAYGRNGWLGLASISITGGTHITSGTVKVNDTYFAMAQYNTPDERAHVMCQEIGHTFGLGHTSEDGSIQNTCMDYSTSPTSTQPNQHDYDQLATIYTHLDSTTTVSSASTAGSRQSGNAQASWGREVHRSANGRHSTFVRHFADGSTVVTEVTWAR